MTMEPCPWVGVAHPATARATAARPTGTSSRSGSGPPCATSRRPIRCELQHFLKHADRLETSMLKIIRTALMGAIALCGAAAMAQDAYPDRMIKIIVPYGPGATTDLMARLVAQKVSDDLKQPVIVDNRAGAGG